MSLDCSLTYTCNQAGVKKSGSDLYFLWSQLMLTLTSAPLVSTGVSWGEQGMRSYRDRDMRCRESLEDEDKERELEIGEQEQEVGREPERSEQRWETDVETR